MAEIHGGRVVAKALKAEGVPYVFTLCGGHVMAIYDGCVDEGIRVIDVRHEQTAAHAADGWARVTGQPGVAVVTAGPGLTDAVTGVANAHRANIPMLIFGGQGPRRFADMGSLQDMNHVELMRPITKWAVSVPEGRRLGRVRQHGLPHRDHQRARTGVPGNADRPAVRAPTKRNGWCSRSSIARRRASPAIRCTLNVPSNCCARRSGRWRSWAVSCAGRGGAMPTRRSPRPSACPFTSTGSAADRCRLAIRTSSP